MSQSNLQKIIQLNKELPELTQYYGEMLNVQFTPIELEDDTKRAYRSISASDKPTGDFRRILDEGLPVVASELNDGRPKMVNHSTWGDGALPVGRTFRSVYRKKSKTVETDWYLDDEDYNQRLIKGIDQGTIRDGSIGADGKFTCSFDNSKMGWFGCFKAGHYRGQEIMIDKNGNETTEASSMVRTEFIYAEFLTMSVEEDSIVWSGAVPDASIIKKYCVDPAQNQQIIEGIRKVYDEKLLDEYELQRLTASYGGIPMILTQSKAPVSVSVTKTLKKEVNNMSTAHTPEVQALLDEKDTRITELETELQASNEKVEGFEENTITEEDITAKDNRIAELEQSEEDLQAKVDAGDVKSAQYDAVVNTLRSKLKLAKRKAGVTGDELDVFSAQADAMSDASTMLELLDTIRGGKSGDTKNYSRILHVEKKKEEYNDAVTQADRARTMAAY